MTHWLRNPNRFFGLVFVVFFLCARTQGADLYTYDLDSLVYLGPEIVEGTLGRLHGNFWKFKISAVDNGDFKVGQSIDVSDLGLFRVATNGFIWGNPLKEGDKLLLFGARTGTTPFYHIPANNKTYWIAPSGVRLIVGEKALRFRQYENPGPYLAVLEGVATNRAIPTVTDFRRQIRESIPRVDAWRPLLDQEPARNNIPALLQLLRQRPPFKNVLYFERDEDFIAGKICQTLAALHDFDALLQAARISGYLWDLGAGFRTPTGRRFLREQMADGREPVETKIICANLLDPATLGDLSECQLQSLAQLAAQPNQNQKLQMALIQSMRAVGNWSQSAAARTNTAILQDKREAGAILVELAKESESEELKYNIDLVLPELGFSPFNSNNCLLQLDRYDPAARNLHLTCRISNVSGLLHPSVAFVNLKTGQKWTAPSNLYFHGDEAESPGDVIVPNDLPPGRYRVFYEFMENGNVKSTSHYFEADL